MSGTLSISHGNALLASTAREQLAGQLDRAISGKLEILRFWSMVTVLQEAAEAFDSQSENQISFSVPDNGKSLSRGRGNVSKPTDLKSIFAECGIAPEKLKTAYRLHADGAAMAAHYEEAVGKRFAAAMPLPALVNTPEDELPEDARKKQQLFFDFVSEERTPKRRGGKTYERDGEKGQRKELSHDQAQLEAMDIWRPMLTDLHREGLKEASWIMLPERGEISLETLRGLLTDLVAKLRAPVKQ